MGPSLYMRNLHVCVRDAIDENERRYDCSCGISLGRTGLRSSRGLTSGGRRAPLSSATSRAREPSTLSSDGRWVLDPVVTAVCQNSGRRNCSGAATCRHKITRSCSAEGRRRKASSSVSVVATGVGGEGRGGEGMGGFGGADRNLASKEAREQVEPIATRFSVLASPGCQRWGGEEARTRWGWPNYYNIPLNS